ncbi:hypothetical protein [Thiomicrorhabdus xiamenensis]|uniref:Uncharacterized protein n=1 Tax=Thiomicrorhabdus xiamenensis TaxID=2739063 RepID=A0A7D4TG70_9GAMM|nr:hypothetical protein [Thiomicrorhabdus xiamenensis]QKI89428.1 hypothetical protein HQN79_07550 [Thiomicrorhabdus xiamenensis]
MIYSSRLTFPVIYTFSVRLFTVLSLLSLQGCGWVAAPDIAHLYEDAAANRVMVCHEYGCKQLDEVEFDVDEKLQIQQVFQEGGIEPERERVAIAEAVALMEKLTGKSVGTWRDKAENDGTGERGQMDCIDESVNTTTYLKFFSANGWLKHHQVMPRVVRNPLFFDVHWTAVIREIPDGRLYAVDSWFRQNGEEPVILPLADWKAKKEAF